MNDSLKEIKRKVKSIPKSVSSASRSNLRTSHVYEIPQEQEPHSMKSGKPILIDCTYLYKNDNVILYRTSKKGKKEKKGKKMMLRYHRDNKLQFYKSPSNLPDLEFVMRGSCKYKRHKNFTISVECFVMPKFTKTTLFIQMSNNMDVSNFQTSVLFKRFSDSGIGGPHVNFGEVEHELCELPVVKWKKEDVIKWAKCVVVDLEVCKEKQCSKCKKDCVTNSKDNTSHVCVTCSEETGETFQLCRKCFKFKVHPPNHKFEKVEFEINDEEEFGYELIHLYNRISAFFEGGSSAKILSSGKKIMGLNRKEISDLVKTVGVNLSFRSRNVLRSEIISLIEEGFYDPVRSIVKTKAFKYIQGGGGNMQISKLDEYVRKHGELLFVQENLKNILYRKGKDNVKKPMVFRVKLIIVENVNNERMKAVRKVFGTFLQVRDSFSFGKSFNFGNLKSSDFSKNTKFGIFHVALSIGPLQLEWVDCSLTIARKVASANVVLCLDVDNVFITDGEEFTLSLAKELLKWNREKKYISINIGSKKKGYEENCQSFVVSMMHSLGVRYEFSDDVKSFMERMKYKGKSDMKFKYSKSFAKTFKLTDPKRKFKPKNHKHLDIFCANLFKKCPTFEKDYNSQYQLLKGFDRSFWLRYMRKHNPKNEPRKRVEDNVSSGCPFCAPHVGFYTGEDTESEEEYDEEKEIEKEDLLKVVDSERIEKELMKSSEIEESNNVENEVFEDLMDKITV